MTSMPASRSALATTLAPRSCPSSPGLATTTPMRPCATVPAAPLAVACRPAPRCRAAPGTILPGHLPAPTPNPGEDDRRADQRPATAARPRPPGPDRLPAAAGGPGAQADPAQPARPRLDRRLGPARGGDPGRRRAVPGQGRPPGPALGPRPRRLRVARLSAPPTGAAPEVAGPAGQVVVVDRRDSGLRALLAPPGPCPVEAAGAGFARPCSCQRWDAGGAPGAGA